MPRLSLLKICYKLLREIILQYWQLNLIYVLSPFAQFDGIKANTVRSTTQGLTSSVQGERIWFYFKKGTAPTINDRGTIWCVHVCLTSVQIPGTSVLQTCPTCDEPKRRCYLILGTGLFPLGRLTGLSHHWRDFIQSTCKVNNNK